MSEASAVFVVGKEAGELAASIQNALADKKVNLAEGIDIAKEVGTLAVAVMKNKDELRGVKLTEQTGYDLMAGIREGYDIADDETEAHVEAVLEGAANIVLGIVLILKDNEEA